MRFIHKIIFVMVICQYYWKKGQKKNEFTTNIQNAILYIREIKTAKLI